MNAPKATGEETRKRPWAAGLLLATIVPLIGCAQPTQPVAPTGAIVRLLDVDGKAAGQAVLTPVHDGVEIVLNVEGLTPGAHGLHIHAQGACAPGPDAAGKTVAFGAAGPHFDPGAAGRHGHPTQGGGHAGDAPNLQANAAGKATLRFVNTRVTLRAGPASVIGRSLVVHADPDDYKTDPAGNSGARVLCGVIQPARMDSMTG